MLPMVGDHDSKLPCNLNLTSDYKFGFYRKIPEKEMFWGQVYGTLLGPFVNYGIMRLVIDHSK